MEASSCAENIDCTIILLMYTLYVHFQMNIAEQFPVYRHCLLYYVLFCKLFPQFWLCEFSVCFQYQHLFTTTIGLLLIKLYTVLKYPVCCQHTCIEQSSTLMHVHIPWGKILANFASFKGGSE